jgi:hypothetical protein
MQRQIGTHPVWIKGDTIFNVLHGPYTLEHMIEYLQLAEQVIAEHGTFFALSDITHLQAVGADTRRHIAQWTRSHPIGGIALVGGGLAMRSVLTLVIHAVNLLRPEKIPLVFVTSEKEGQSWLAARRQQLRAAG